VAARPYRKSARAEIRSLAVACWQLATHPDGQPQSAPASLTLRDLSMPKLVRMSTLYVDLSPGRWNRPVKEFTQQHAHKVLQQAVNDYKLHRSQDYVDLEIVKSNNPELYKAPMQWSDRPELPPAEDPTWPS